MVASVRRFLLWSLLAAPCALACGRTTLAPPAAVMGSGAQPVAADAVAPEPPAETRQDAASPSVPDIADRSAPDLAPDLRNLTCGNGRLDPAEECDDGNTLSGDGCAANCTVECDWSPCPYPPYALIAVCGDGRVSPGESCDDGNTTAGDGCSDICAVEPGFRCARPGFRCTPSCGDGRMVGGETCDDGNTASGDGCSENCLVEPCWKCTGTVCLPR
jgi:cysteine-rich repeat protein